MLLSEIIPSVFFSGPLKLLLSKRTLRGSLGSLPCQR